MPTHLGATQRYRFTKTVGPGSRQDALGTGESLSVRDTRQHDGPFPFFNLPKLHSRVTFIGIRYFFLGQRIRTRAIAA